MPSLANHLTTPYVKLLLIGDPLTGKTGSLVSLVAADFKLRILDLDNKLDVLAQYIKHQCPDKIGNVEYRSIRDKYKSSAGGAVIAGAPKAFVEVCKMLDRWKYTDEDGTEVDLGCPADWGPDCILVVDSLTRLFDACFDWQDVLNVPGKSGERDGRATFYAAQNAAENFLAMITGEGMATNLIVIAHGQYMALPDGTTKIMPQGIGQKLSPIIPSYFPNVVRYKNQSGKRTIQLKSDAMIDLAQAAPFSMPDSLPIETGLAEIFAVLRGEQQQAPTANPPKPKSLRLSRV